MAVPKKRHNSSRGKRRRGGHQKLQPKNFSKCPECGQAIEMHRACPFCGSYKGRKLSKEKSAKK